MTFEQKSEEMRAGALRMSAGKAFQAEDAAGAKALRSPRA